MTFRSTVYHLAVCIVAVGLLSSCGLRRHKYDDPITKNTQQPDKVLFDRAINDLEHSRYEVARLTLQTLINTYDTSEYLAKAKLAIADSWFREAGAHGLAQAEAEYKDFILFYPTMEESAEAQARVCDIHYKQMEKADRDPEHAVRAQDECRQLLVQFPNSKFAPDVEQKLRNIQEVLAAHEYVAAAFYHHKGSYPAAANRYLGLVDQFPLFSQADEALWELADSYSRMGDRFEDKAAATYSRIVKDYPLSDHVQASKERLQAMNRPVPPADPVAYARMKYEQENRTSASFVSQVLGAFKKNPDTRAAAKSGTPAMSALRPPIPVSVPVPAGTVSGVSSDVTVSTVGDSKELDSRPDARMNPPAAGATGATDAAAKPADAPASPVVMQQPLATNHPVKPKKQKKPAAKKKTDDKTQPVAVPSPAQGTAAPAAAPAPTSPNPPTQ